MKFGYLLKIALASGFSTSPSIDILGRMAGHGYKKNALLRNLHSWRV